MLQILFQITVGGDVFDRGAAEFDVFIVAEAFLRHKVFLAFIVGADKVKVTAPKRLFGRQFAVGAQKTPEIFAGDFFPVIPQRVGKGMIAIFDAVIFVASIEPDGKVIQKVVQGFAFFLKNLFHILAGGNVFYTPEQVGVFFDGFDRKAAFENVGFFEVKRFDADGKPFFGGKYFSVIVTLIESQRYFFPRQVCTGGFQSMKGRAVGILCREMFFQIGEQGFSVKHFFRRFVLQYRFAVGVVNADDFIVVADDFVGESAVCNGFFGGGNGFNRLQQAADGGENKSNTSRSRYSGYIKNKTSATVSPIRA